MAGSRASEVGRDPARVVATIFEQRAVRREGAREMPLGPKAAHTRERILAAAAACFVDHGYQQTTVADVAAAAGVSLGTVYQYFRDRSDLVVALVRQGVADMLGRADTTWRAEEGLEGLNRVVTNFVSSYAEAAGV